MMKRALIPIVMLAMLVAGCAIEPPLHLRQAIRIIVKVLWRAQVYPEGFKPTGVTLYFFKDGVFCKSIPTANVDSCVVELEPGRYKLYMISQTTGEFAHMDFDNMHDFDNAVVHVTDASNNWYTPGENERMLDNPDEMVVGVSDEFEVSDDFIEQYLHSRKNKDKDKKDPTKAGEDTDSDDIYTAISYYTIRVPVNPMSIVSQYWVTIYTDNVDMLSGVRASTTGMARSFMLTQDVTGDDEGTQFITAWSVTIDDAANKIGHLDGRITTFGFPNGDSPSPLRDPELNVATLLVDNKTVERYVFYIGDKITSEDPPPGFRNLYRVVFGSAEAPAIHPSTVVPVVEQAGFDVDVGDWGDGDDIDLDI